MTRCAFTLIEVMAVVVLVGLLAGAAALSLAGQARYRTTQDVIDTLQSVDRNARFAAMRLGGTTRIRYDLSNQQVYNETTDDTGSSTRSPAVAFPVEYRIDRVLVSDVSATSGASRSTTGRALDYGTIDIELSPAGRSTTYAVRLSHEENKHWLIFAGLTGQVTQTDDEKEVNNLFTMLASGRPDAD